MTNTSSTIPTTDQRLNLAELNAVVANAGAMLALLSPDDIPLPECPLVWSAFMQLERFGSAGRLLMTRRVAESNVAAQTGKRTATEWMAERSGAPAGRAHADLATSERLADLDRTAQALKRGELSGHQAGVVADAAAANPAAERDLLGRARTDSYKGLNDEAKRRKQQADPDPQARHRRHHKERKAGFYTDGDGKTRFYAEGPAANSPKLLGLERRTDQLFKKACKTGGVVERREAYMYDAFMELLDHTTATATATDGPPTSDASASPTLFEDPDAPASAPTAAKGRAKPAKYLGMIHVDLSALINGRVSDSETCEIPGIGPVPVEAIRELLGDSILKLVITNGVDVANITHLGRGPSAAQKIALLWTNRLCTRLGCNRTRLEYDHRLDHQYTKHTRLDELDGLCKHDHDLKTRYG